MPNSFAKDAIDFSCPVKLDDSTVVTSSTAASCAVFFYRQSRVMRSIRVVLGRKSRNLAASWTRTSRPSASALSPSSHPPSLKESSSSVNSAIIGAHYGLRPKVNTRPLRGFWVVRFGGTPFTVLNSRIRMDIWHESFWLPEGVHWKDLQSTPTVQYPDAWDLRYTIYFGAALLVLRILVESFVFLPIGYLCGWIQPGRDGLTGRVFSHLGGGFAGKSKFKRIAETAWRCLFYLCAWISGFLILRSEAHLYDVTECWRNWPHHPISNSVWWYYIIETSFYWALLFSTVFFDIRRHDFVQMVLHHGITILLLWISFSLNMLKVGSLVLFSHDFADIFLDLGKLFNYAKWERPLKIVFATFMVTWIVTRLIYYPLWIINSVIFDAPELIQKSYRWENLLQRPIVPRVLCLMLCALLVLHVFWTWLILKIAVKSATEGEVDDVRESEDDDEPKSTKED